MRIDVGVYVNTPHGPGTIVDLVQYDGYVAVQVELDDGDDEWFQAEQVSVLS